MKRLYSLEVEGRCQIKRYSNELKISSGKVFRELFMEEMLFSMIILQELLEL